MSKEQLSFPTAVLPGPPSNIDEATNPSPLPAPPSPLHPLQSQITQVDSKATVLFALDEHLWGLEKTQVPTQEGNNRTDAWKKYVAPGTFWLFLNDVLFSSKLKLKSQALGHVVSSCPPSHADYWKSKSPTNARASAAKDVKHSSGPASSSDASYPYLSHKFQGMVQDLVKDVCAMVANDTPEVKRHKEALMALLHETSMAVNNTTMSLLNCMHHIRGLLREHSGGQTSINQYFKSPGKRRVSICLWMSGCLDVWMSGCLPPSCCLSVCLSLMVLLILLLSLPHLPLSCRCFSCCCSCSYCCCCCCCCYCYC